MTIQFVTAADTVYFSRLCGLIGSIIRKSTSDYNISVYDLGLLPNELDFLNRIPNLQVLSVEKVNPYILEAVRSHDKGSETTVIGLYSWKPVIFKQALEKYDRIIYLDAGTSIIHDLLPLWQHLEKVGYFFIGVCDINYMCTNYVIEKLVLSKEIRGAQGINAGIQGVSRKVLDNYVLPVYEMAKDFKFFIDDGTAQGGITFGRHDQTLFSIQRAKNNFEIKKGWDFSLETETVTNKFSMAGDANEIKADTLVYHCRGNADHAGDMTWILRKYCYITQGSVQRPSGEYHAETTPTMNAIKPNPYKPIV